MLEGAGPKAAARSVGTPNKMTRAFKDMILQALADLGASRNASCGAPRDNRPGLPHRARW
jgi:hypothetical protein